MVNAVDHELMGHRPERLPLFGRELASIGERRDAAHEEHLSPVDIADTCDLILLHEECADLLLRLGHPIEEVLRSFFELQRIGTEPVEDLLHIGAIEELTAGGSTEIYRSTVEFSSKSNGVPGRENWSLLPAMATVESEMNVDGLLRRELKEEVLPVGVGLLEFSTVELCSSYGEAPLGRCDLQGLSGDGVPLIGCP